MFVKGMPNLWVIFLTGLVTGGISCMAVQGGLLASVLAVGETSRKTWAHTLRSVVFFLIGKVSVYTLLGAFLGFLGSSLQLSITMNAVFMILASLFMIFSALNLLNVHPIFRFFVLQPPRFLYRIARSESRKVDWFAPLAIGVLTVFLPCGTTQAMMLEAMQFGNPLLSASILFAFTIGTIPLFLLFGVFFHAASSFFTKYFAPVAATLVIGLALWNLSNVFAIVGWATPVTRFVRFAYCQVVYCDDMVAVGNSKSLENTQEPVIVINATSYAIENPYIPAGASIRLSVRNVRGNGCIQFFTIPKLNIQKVIPVGTTEIIEFTAPAEKGELPFMCSMGMYRGMFIVR